MNIKYCTMYFSICRQTPETGQRKGRRDTCGCQKSFVRKQQDNSFWLKSDSLVWYSVEMSVSTDLNFQSKFIPMFKISMSNPSLIHRLTQNLHKYCLKGLHMILFLALSQLDKESVLKIKYLSSKWGFESAEL